MLPENTMQPQSSENIEVTNSARLFAKKESGWTDLDITDSDGVSVPKPVWVEKEGDTNREPGNGAETEWKVTFYLNGYSFDTGNQLTLHDKLPEHSTLKAGSVKVNGTGVEAVPSADGFMISDIAATGEKVEITYQTTIPESAFETSENLGRNEAYFTFQMGGRSYTTETAAADVGSGIPGLGTSLILKTNPGYEYQTRSITWTVTINPHQVDIAGASFIDDLKTTGGTCDIHDVAGLELVGDVEVKFDETNVSEEIKNRVSVRYDSQKLTIDVGDIGRHTVELIYTTKVCDPCLFANNKQGETYFWNKVSGEICYRSGEKQPVSAGSQVYFYTKVLEKQAPVYDYAAAEMTWTINLNELGPLTDLGGQSIMTDIELTDVLPKGMSYKGSSVAPEKVNVVTDENGRQMLTFHLGTVGRNEKVTIKTEVDWSELGFDIGQTETEVTNMIKMQGKADGKDFEVSDTVSRTFVNHGLVKRDTVEEQAELIAYEVFINPYGLVLPAGSTLVDTMDKRLQLDWDTLRFYEAELSGTTGEGGAAPGYTKIGEGQSLTVKEYDAENNSFTVELPVSEGDTKAYVLTYTADIVDYQNGSYENSISFHGGTLLLGGCNGSSNSASVGGGGGGGGGGGVASRKATIVITKTDKENPAQKLEDVTFSLYQYDNVTGKRGLLFAQGTTDANGTLSFRVKPGAVYELVETTPHAGYYADFVCESASEPAFVERRTDGSFIITAGGKGTTLDLELSNEVCKTDIALKLVTETGIPMAGQLISIVPVDDAGNQNGMKVTVQVLADGTVKFEHVKKGVYQIMDADENLIVTITVSEDASVVTAVLPDNTAADLSNPLSGSLASGTKQWSLTAVQIDKNTKKPLTGAVFGLYADASCQLLIGEKIVDAEGKLTFSGLIEGQTYYLKEIKAPNGYFISGQVFQMKEAAAEITVENEAVSKPPVNTPQEPEPPVGEEEKPQKPEPPVGEEEKPQKPEPPAGEEEKPQEPEPPTGEIQKPQEPTKEDMSSTENMEQKKEEQKTEPASAQTYDNLRTGDKTSVYWCLLIDSGLFLVSLCLYIAWKNQEENIQDEDI